MPIIGSGVADRAKGAGVALSSLEADVLRVPLGMMCRRRIGCIARLFWQRPQVISRQVEGRIWQAMILAAGPGNAMRPLTKNLQKPMVPILGKPVLEYLIEHLARYGVREI